MNAVPSTPTFSDSLKEHKDLKDSNAALRTDNENLKRENHIYATTKTALLRELAAHGVMPDLKEKVLGNVRNALQDSIQSRREEEKTLLVTLGALKDDRKSLCTSNDALRAENGALGDSNKALKAEVSTLTDTINALKREYSERCIEEDKRLQAILKNKDEAKEKLDQYNKEYADKILYVTEGDRRLSEKSQDLAIYEARLRKACLELYPEMEIILSNYD